MRLATGNKPWEVILDNPPTLPHLIVSPCYWTCRQLVASDLLIWGPNPIQMSGTNAATMQSHCKGTKAPVPWGSLSVHPCNADHSTHPVGWIGKLDRIGPGNITGQRGPTFEMQFPQKFPPCREFRIGNKNVHLHPLICRMSLYGWSCAWKKVRLQLNKKWLHLSLIACARLIATHGLDPFKRVDAALPWMIRHEAKWGAHSWPYSTITVLVTVRSFLAQQCSLNPHFKSTHSYGAIAAVAAWLFNPFLTMKWAL